MRHSQKRHTCRFKFQFDQLELRSLLSTAGHATSAGASSSADAAQQSAAAVSTLNAGGGGNTSSGTSRRNHHVNAAARSALRARQETNFIVSLYQTDLG